jgi:hypothetical protein
MRIIGYALLVAAAFAGCAGSQAPGADAGGSQAQLMFIQSADDLRVDAARSTLRLVKVNPQTLYFSDRPQRIAGNLKMADYLNTWKEGRDNSAPIRRTRPFRCTSRGVRIRRSWWSRS